MNNERRDGDVKAQAISRRCSSQEEPSPQRRSAHLLERRQCVYSELLSQSLEEHQHEEC